MTTQNWTPAPRRGSVPLHPLPFGTILGRAFSALRHNPSVLFGFAVLVQFATYAVTFTVLFTIMGVGFSRLDTLRPGTDEYAAVEAGMGALLLISALVLGLGSAVFTAILQGIVAANVRSMALGRKARLSALWAQVRPAAWRLIGYTLLMLLAVSVAVGALLFLSIAVVFALSGGASGGAPSGVGIGFGIMIVIVLWLGFLVLCIWLGTKLLLVPSTLVVEHTTIREALVRSWRLTNGRFWVAFGVTILIGLIMMAVSYVIAIPFSILSMLIGGVLLPTGDPLDSDIASGSLALILLLVLPQALSVLVSAVAAVVQSTAAALVYLDSRMRYEGLDQALLAHLERRAAGVPETQLGDPYAVDPQRAVRVRPPQQPAAYAQPYAAPYGHGQPGPQQTHNMPPQGYTPRQGYAPPPYAPPQNRHHEARPQQPSRQQPTEQPPVPGGPGTDTGSPDELRRTDEPRSADEPRDPDGPHASDGRGRDWTAPGDS